MIIFEYLDIVFLFIYYLNIKQLLLEQKNRLIHLLLKIVFER